MTPLQSALIWRALGVAAIPIRYRDKRPLVAWNEFRERLPSTRELYGWFHGQRGNPPLTPNLGLVCGWQGLTVIDFDDQDIYGAWRAWALASSGIAALVAELSYQVQTRRGVHVYVSLEGESPSNPHNMKLYGIDIKAAGGYVLAPPSVHPSGVAYRAIHDGAPIIRAGTLDDVLPVVLLAQPEPETRPLRPRRVNELPTDPWLAAWEPARIADDSVGPVSDALARLDLRAMLPHPIYKRGSRYITRCPLHDDHDPSMTYDPETDKVYCFAGCTQGHWYDAIDLYAAMSGLKLNEAIRVLAS